MNGIIPRIVVQEKNELFSLPGSVGYSGMIFECIFL